MNKLNLSGVSKEVLVRGLITVVAMINIIAGYLGWHILPITDADAAVIVNGIVVILTAGVWLWGWWKNNSFTVNAQIADYILDEMNNEDAAEEAL